MTEKVIKKVGNNYSILYKNYFADYDEVRYFRLTKNRKLYASFSIRVEHDETSFKRFCRTLCPNLILLGRCAYTVTHILKIIDNHNRKEKLSKLLSQ